MRATTRLVACLLAVALAACSMSADTNRAEALVPTFHAALDAQQYDAIYDATSDDFRKATTQVEFVAMLESVRGRLGTFRSSTRQGLVVNYNGDGTLVTLTYASSFADGDAEELFLVRIDGGRARLAGYRVNSRVLPDTRPSTGGMRVEAITARTAPT